jgi:hypothetical protein
VVSNEAVADDQVGSSVAVCGHEGDRPYVVLNHWSGGIDRWPVCVECARSFELAIRRFDLKLLNLEALPTIEPASAPTEPDLGGSK